MQASPVKVVHGVNPGDLRPADLLALQQPVVLRGLVRDWPLVKHGTSAQAVVRYLCGFDSGKEITGYTGPPSIGGRYFYSNAPGSIDGPVAGGVVVGGLAAGGVAGHPTGGMMGVDPNRTAARAMNFVAERVGLTDYLNRMLQTLDRADAPSLYVGSTDVDTYLPGLRTANDLGVGDAAFGGEEPRVSVWIGNRTIAATHYDMSNNIACCAVGRRRFTLFPPDQIANLYPGPLEPTPGGQVVSMVDLRAPDLERFPRFATAMACAQVAELEPGDAILYPALWWHNVEALDPFNVMINCWWNTSPRFLDSPMAMLLQGLLSLRDRPLAEKQGWRAILDYYVFGDPDLAGAHLAESVRGVLGPIDANAARGLRAQMLERLNR